MVRGKSKSGGKYLRRGAAFVVVLALGTGAGACSLFEPEAEEVEVGEALELVIEPVEVTRPAPEPAVATANTAITLAANQYIYARLLTEQLMVYGDDLESQSERSDLYGETLDAWDDAEIAIEGAIDVLDELEASGALGASASGEAEERDDESRRDTRRRADRDRAGEAEWAAPFTTQLDEETLTDYLYEFAFQMEDDAADLGDIVWGEEAVLTDTKASSKELDGLIREVDEVAQVRVMAAFYGHEANSTVRTLPSSEEAAADPEAFVVEGVEGLLMVSERGRSTIMVADQDQVAVTSEVLDEAGDQVSAVIALLEVDPASFSPDEPANAAPFIGTNPRQWFLGQKILGIGVNEQRDGSLSLRLLPIPRGKNTKQTAANMRKAGIDPQPATEVTVDGLARRVSIEPRIVQTTIEVMVTIARDGGDRDDGSAEQAPRPERPARPTEPQAPSQPEVAQGIVTGTYDVAYEYPDGTSDTGSAEVSLDGESMTLVFVNAWEQDVLTGVYDAVSTTFTGHDADYLTDITIVFEVTMSPVTAVGDAFSSTVGLGSRFYMTKVG